MLPTRTASAKGRWGLLSARGMYWTEGDEGGAGCDEGRLRSQPANVSTKIASAMNFRRPPNGP